MTRVSPRSRLTARQRSAVGYATAYVGRVGTQDGRGQIVPPCVRENGSRLIAWAMRRGRRP